MQINPVILIDITEGHSISIIIAGVDGNSSALIKIYDPDCSFKISQGAVRDVARAEMDTMVGMVDGKIDKNKFQVIQAFVKEIDYWQTSIDDAQVFLMDNYGYKGKLAVDVAKGKKK